MSAYTLKRLDDVEDSAAKFGFGETQESRFANDDLETEQTGLSYHRVRAGKRQAFAHRHEQAEEVYVVVAGSGRAKLDDEVVEVGPLDAIRVSPGIIRAFEGGPEGLALLAFGPLRPDDRGEMLQGWWSD
jgi:mannose-6-phosphate isomerase-like protein (cupin superfamily)